jgi:hypothetical protein
MTRLHSESGAILLTAFSILALLVIILTALISFGSWHKARCLLFLNRVKASYLAEAGIQHAVAALDDRSLGRNRDDIVSTQSGYFEYSIRPWGAYLTIASKGVSGKAEEKLTATVGQLPPSIFANVLALTGPPYPLLVAGSTRIRGNILVGPAGVSKGELHGQSYRGDSLVFGSVSALQARQIPEFQDDLVQEFLDSLRRLERSCPTSDLTVQITSASSEKADLRPILKTTAEIVFDVNDSATIRQPQYYFSGSVITVTGRSRLRHLVLCSGRSIQIGQDANLSDCILVSPGITVADRSEVAGQLLADSAVFVKDQARLADMTLVYLLGQEKDNEITGLVQISSRRTAEACLIFNAAEMRTNSPSAHGKRTGRIQIDPGSTLDGIVWTNGYLDIRGSLRGSAVANLLYYYDAPTLYLNWLVDSDIDESEETGGRVLPLLFGHSKQYEFKKLGPG